MKTMTLMLALLGLTATMARAEQGTPTGDAAFYKETEAKDGVLAQAKDFETHIKKTETERKKSRASSACEEAYGNYANIALKFRKANLAGRTELRGNAEEALSLYSQCQLSAIKSGMLNRPEIITFVEESGRSQKARLIQTLVGNDGSLKDFDERLAESLRRSQEAFEKTREAPAALSDEEMKQITPHLEGKRPSKLKS